MAAQQPQYPTFTGLQQQGVARPPQATWGATPGAAQQAQGTVYGEGRRPDPSQMLRASGQQPQVDQSRPPAQTPQQVPQSGAHPPQAQQPMQRDPQPQFQQAQGQPQNYSPQPMPNLQNEWQHLYDTSQGQGHFGGGPQSSYSPGGYQGPGNLHAYQGSNYQGPQVQAQGHFNAPQGGQQVDQQTQQSIMQALGNPSRYGGQQAQDTFNVLNRQLTQSGNADYNRINEDMARRGLYYSTTAGGRLGDLATNLNNQRADYATQIATDQARNYQTDRASAIGQAMGFGGQQFGQGLQTFGANQDAGQQRFNQQMGAGQFGLQQNNQNFNQQYQQYGANQQEGLNRFNSGLDQAQFGLNQNNQNFNQRYNTFGANQAANQQAYGQQMGAIGGMQNFGQQGFNNQYQTAQFNADQQNENTRLQLAMLGYT